MLGGLSTFSVGQAKVKPTRTPKITTTVTRTRTPSVTPSRTITPTISPTNTITRTPSGEILPYYGAPLCPTHDNTKWHSLWDSVLGCHYDHEHGANPHTSQVALAFPKFNLDELLCGVQIGHCNPTSLMENTHKHGGWKIQVQIPTPNGCANGFEGAERGVGKAVIWYHNFGRYDVELESRNHSSIFLLEICNPNNPSDVGQLFVTTHEEYGLRPAPYQGIALEYPNNPAPYNPAFGPYWSTGCIGNGLPNCQQLTVQDIVRLNQNVSSTVTGKKTGTGIRPPVSRFPILFRSIDNYQVVNTSDLVYPFTWLFVCSTDGGITFNPVGCRWNNSTSMVHEIAGVIPSSWDNLVGFDINPVVGRITAKGFVTHLGELNLNCIEVGLDCHPIQMENMFVGSYGASLAPVGGKGTFSNENLPERDVYFCQNLLCTPSSFGATPSGWISDNN